MEKILNEQFNKVRNRKEVMITPQKTLFLVKWEGYPDSENTWEYVIIILYFKPCSRPESDLRINCQSLIDEYRERKKREALQIVDLVSSEDERDVPFSPLIRFCEDQDDPHENEDHDEPPQVHTESPVPDLPEKKSSPSIAQRKEITKKRPKRCINELRLLDPSWGNLRFGHRQLRSTDSYHVAYTRRRKHAVQDGVH